jgi:hypothetical protein
MQFLEWPLEGQFRATGREGSHSIISGGGMVTVKPKGPQPLSCQQHAETKFSGRIKSKVDSLDGQLGPDHV